ncbi:MAG: hypothetical protein H6702_18385 [Myxococcales bacterium]|nr:hypothetical protein [Myxococcales bacterium]
MIRPSLLIAGVVLAASASPALAEPNGWTFACRKGALSALSQWRHGKAPAIVNGRAVEGRVCLDVQAAPKLPTTPCTAGATLIRSPMFHDAQMFRHLVGKQFLKDVRGDLACARVFQPVRLECEAGLRLMPLGSLSAGQQRKLRGLALNGAICAEGRKPTGTTGAVCPSGFRWEEASFWMRGTDQTVEKGGKAFTCVKVAAPKLPAAREEG